LNNEVVDGVRDVGDQVDYELERLAGKLAQVRVVKRERREVGEVLRAAVERAQHLGRGNAPGERCREEGAGRKPDVDIEVGRLAVDEDIIERLQAAQLVGAAGDRTDSQHERDARVLLAPGQI